MKVTLEKLINSQLGFDELAALKAGEIAPGLAFDIAEMMEEVNAIFKSYNKIVSDLRNKYSEKNDVGDLVIKPSTQKEIDFVSEIAGIQSREYELNFPNLNKGDLINSDKCLLSIRALSSILWLIKKDKKDGD